MTSNVITEREICLVNMSIAGSSGATFAISRPHNVRLIISQLNQLQDASFERKVAHMAYMVKKLAPFSCGNIQTAVLAAHYMFEQTGRDATLGLHRLGGLLKHDVSIEAIEKVIST